LHSQQPSPIPKYINNAHGANNQKSLKINLLKDEIKRKTDQEHNYELNINNYLNTNSNLNDFKQENSPIKESNSFENNQPNASFLFDSENLNFGISEIKENTNKSNINIKDESLIFVNTIIPDNIHKIEPNISSVSNYESYNITNKECYEEYFSRLDNYNQYILLFSNDGFDEFNLCFKNQTNIQSYVELSEQLSKYFMIGKVFCFKGKLTFKY
jgi:hypothetical protein